MKKKATVIERMLQPAAYDCQIKLEHRRIPIARNRLAKIRKTLRA